jgi:hypothetical protein
MWWGTCGRGRVNEGDEGEGIRLKQNNEISCNYFKWGGEGVQGKDCGSNLTSVQCEPIENYHNESPLYPNIYPNFL